MIRTIIVDSEKRINTTLNKIKKTVEQMQPDTDDILLFIINDKDKDINKIKMAERALNNFFENQCVVLC